MNCANRNTVERERERDLGPCGERKYVQKKKGEGRSGKVNLALDRKIFFISFRLLHNDNLNQNVIELW